MSHSVVWYQDEEGGNPKCDFQDCEDQAQFYMMGLRIHSDCTSESVPDRNGDDRQLNSWELRACLDTEELGFLMCSFHLELFTSKLPDLDV